MQRRAGLLGLAALVIMAAGCRRGIIRAAVKHLGDESAYEAVSGPLSPSFSGKDLQREQLGIQLLPVADSFVQPVDLVFLPGSSSQAVVLERVGNAVWVDLDSGARQPWLSVDAATEAEQGLLGLAFHPRFDENGKFYLNYTIRDGKDYTVVEEWDAPQGVPGDAQKRRELLRVAQPYQNHNGGDLAFGPDGMLYVGLGDGGAKDDIHGYAQDGRELLGSMLRLDVDGDSIVPADNPFLDDPDVRDEAYALGLRNPWRYTFAPSGQLVVADVGQDAWEEISVVSAGDNLGWPHREADRCFKPAEGCRTDGLVEPIFSYGRAEGQSITGGVVLTGNRAPQLRGRYLFGDFVSGRRWALSVPETPQPVEAVALGQWPLLISSFATDADGDGYVIDFGSGTLYAITTPEDPALASAGGAPAAVDYNACAACHGADGHGSAEVEAPALAGLPADYLARQLQNYRSGARTSDQMQSLAARLSDDDIASLSAELSSLPPAAVAPTVTGGDAERGATLYAVCGACHGADGAGVAAMGTPSLVAQQDWYIADQLNAFRDGRRGAGDGYGAQMVAGVAGLGSEQDVADVVAYIQTLYPASE